MSGSPDDWRSFKCNLCARQFRMRWPFDTALKVAMFEHLRDAHGLALSDADGAPGKAGEIPATES